MLEADTHTKISFPHQPHFLELHPLGWLVSSSSTTLQHTHSKLCEKDLELELSSVRKIFITRIIIPYLEANAPKLPLLALR